MPRGIRNPPDFYAITRTRYAWEVRLTRDKVRLGRTFNFNNYGNKVLALEAARAWRDARVIEHPPKSRQARASKLTAANVSGVAGVTVQYGKDGQPVRWLAKTYLGPGRVLRKAFGVARYGPNAQGLAVAERKRQLSFMTGLATVHPAEATVRAAARTTGPMPVALDRARTARLRSTNRSGVPGVVRRKGSAGGPGYWTAQTVLSGQWISKSFSVKAHGDAGAKALAVAERADQLRRQAVTSTATFQSHLPAPSL